MQTAVACDVLSVLCYVAVVYFRGTGGWLISGLHLCLQYCIRMPSQRVVVVSILQVSHTCRHAQSLVPPKAALVISMAGLLMAALSNTPEYQRAPARHKAVLVMLVYTLSASVRYIDEPVVDVLRVAVFVCLNHLLSLSLDEWTSAAQSCWLLVCQSRSLLLIGLLQLAQAARDARERRAGARAADDIETWALRSGPDAVAV